MLWTRAGWSTRALNAYGFGLLALSCTGLAIAVRAAAPPLLKFALFCWLNFVLQFGPNVATFVLPTELFPTELRSTFFGLAAGMGKVGALLGSGCFGPITSAVGVDGVFFVCAAISALGLLVTCTLLPHTPPPSSARLGLAALDSAPLAQAGDAEASRVASRDHERAR